MISKLAITEFTANATDTIWDVRDAKAYAEGHIEHATNQPLASLTAELLASVPDPVYVLCGGGSKAGRAADTLQGFDGSRNIVILTGGTRGAKAVGMCIVTGNLPTHTNAE